MRKVSAGVLATCAVIVLPSSVMAVPIPFVEDFNDAAEGMTEFRSNTGAAATSTWSLTGNAYQHTLAAPGSGATQFAGTGIFGNGMTVPSDFRVQASFNVSDISGTTGVARVGLFALAKSASELATWTANCVYYAADVTVSAGGDAALALRQGRASNTQLTLASGTLPGFALNTTYSMTLIGDFNASGDLNMAFTVGDTTVTVPTILAANVIASNAYFGIRDYADNYRNLTVTYDDVLLTNVIPEPTTAAVAGLIGISALSRRRRHRA